MSGLLDCYYDLRYFAVYQFDFAERLEGSSLDLIDGRIQGPPGVRSRVVPYLQYLAMNFKPVYMLKTY
jgi:hypothetical protein